MIADIGALVVAYLIGSIPAAYLVTRLRTGQDIRQVGEGNAGARNVWHVAGRGWGVVVGVEAVEGAVAVAVRIKET